MNSEMCYRIVIDGLFYINGSSNKRRLYLLGDDEELEDKDILLKMVRTNDQLKVKE